MESFLKNSLCLFWNTHIHILPHPPVKSAWQAERSVSTQQGKEFHGNSPPGALAFSFTHILIVYSRVSLVYGSMSSLLIFYYKCLLRLNSVIVFQGPSSLQTWNLSLKSSRTAERKLPIQLLIKHYKDSSSELVYKIFTKDSSNSHPNEGTIELENPTETEIFSTARYKASH